MRYSIEHNLLDRFSMKEGLLLGYSMEEELCLRYSVEKYLLMRSSMEKTYFRSFMDEVLPEFFFYEKSSPLKVLHRKYLFLSSSIEK